MDVFDMATHQEELQRAIALKAAMNRPGRDYVAEICTGCDFATKTNLGQSCDVWADCLADFAKRDRAK